MQVTESLPLSYPAGALFERGRVYHRLKEIHGVFDGQRNGGISTPRGQNLIFLFTGEVGAKFGYADALQPDGLFHYCGEGQVGPQKFKYGNKAVLNHASDGKELHLFRKVVSTQYRYEGEFVYSGHHFEEAEDRLGALRQVIIFELIPLESVGELPATDDQHLSGSTMVELRELALSGGPGGTVSRSAVVRRRSAAVARYARQRAKGVCEGCGAGAPFVTSAGEPFLEVHHLRRMSDGGPDHPRWVAAICPNCHRRVHHAKDGAEFNAQIAATVGELEA